MDDLVSRLADALRRGGPLPLGIVDAWRVDGERAWREADTLVAMRTIAWCVTGNDPYDVIMVHWDARHLERNGPRTLPGMCCCDVVRAVVPVIAVERLTGWGRAERSGG
jgi:hypothetical protein